MIPDPRHRLANQSKVHHRGTEVQRLEKVQHERYKRYRDGSWRNRGRSKFGLKTAQQWRGSTLKPCRVDADVLITVATTTKTYIVTN